MRCRAHPNPAPSGRATHTESPRREEPPCPKAPCWPSRSSTPPPSIHPTTSPGGDHPCRKPPGGRTNPRPPRPQNHQQRPPGEISSAQQPVSLPSGTSLTSKQQISIAESDTFFVASASAAGDVDVSHRGGNPG